MSTIFEKVFYVFHRVTCYVLATINIIQYHYNIRQLLFLKNIEVFFRYLDYKHTTVIDQFLELLYRPCNDGERSSRFSQ